MILNEVKINDNRYSYKFHLIHSGRTGAAGRATVHVISGRVVEKGADWLRVRQSSTRNGEHDDTLIPLTSINYITENYSRE